MRYAAIYCLKVWLTMTLLSPVLTLAIWLYNVSGNNVLLKGINKSLIYHRLLSDFLRMLWGSAIIFLVVVCGVLIMLYLLKEKTLSINRLKFYAGIVAIVLVALPFVIAYCQLGNSPGQRIVAYVYIRNLLIDIPLIIISVWFYKLRRPQIELI